MNIQSKKVSYRIARRAGYQGARPSVSGQAGVEKSATDLPSQENVDGNSSGRCFQQSHLQQQLAQFVINKTKLNDTNGHEGNIRK